MHPVDLGSESAPTRPAESGYFIGIFALFWSVAAGTGIRTRRTDAIPAFTWPNILPAPRPQSTAPSARTPAAH